MTDVATFHALDVEPRSARPGDTVTLRFRMRNYGVVPTPAALLRFVVSELLEPLGELEVALSPVEPGGELIASLDVRVARGLDDTATLDARAVLELGDRTFATNVCTVVVRSRPVLDGSASGVVVERLDDDTLRVRAVVVNEGDGPAHHLRLVVPPPAGTEAHDVDATTLAIERLDAGDAARIAYDVRIVTAADVFCADAAYVTTDSATRWPLASRNEIAPWSTIDGCVSVGCGRTRAEVSIDVVNTGWADAENVPIRIELPPPSRIVEGTLNVDGTSIAYRSRRRSVDSPIARASLEDSTISLVVARVPARDRVRCALSAAIRPNTVYGPLRVDINGDVTCAEILPELRREVKARIFSAPRRLEPGTSASIGVEVCNTGDVMETVSLLAAIDDIRIDDLAVNSVIAPGLIVTLPFSFAVPEEITHGGSATLTITATDERGERVRIARTLPVSEEPLLVVDDPPRVESGRALYVVRNAGNSAARDVTAIAGEMCVTLGTIAPAVSVTADFDINDVRNGGIVRIGERDRLALVPPRETARLASRSTVTAPETVTAGAAFPVATTIDVQDDIDVLVVRMGEVDGFRYVGGSTSVDGRSLLDRVGTSPLAGDGLVLRGVPRGTIVRIAWSLVAEARPDQEMRQIACDVFSDYRREVVEPATVLVRHQALFPLHHGAAYYVEAFSSEAPPPAAEATDAIAHDQTHDAFTFVMPLDDERLDSIARLLRGGDRPGLASHALALRALFPSLLTSDDAALSDAFRATELALRDVFDRLFVKLRIPGFDVASSDLEDAALRRALVTLLDHFELATPGEPQSDGAVVRVDRTSARVALAAIADAPYGAPAMLRALALLIPTTCDDPLLAAALTRYASALDAAFQRFEGAPLELFDVALASGRDDDLDDARAGVLSALRARTIPVAVFAR